MAQNDLIISNQSFPSFRTDLNNALLAIQTTHSGTTTPANVQTGQIWLDTTSATTPTLKYYDGADNISLATLDHSANTVNWLDSTVSITGLSTTATGTVLTLSDSVNTTTVNLIIDNQKEIRFRETTANGTNFVAIKAPASVSADLTFTLPATDGTSGQVLQTNGSGVLSFSTISGSVFGTALLHVRDEKAGNTAGGTFTSGSFQTRTLNTELTNEISGASLSSNQIILPSGTYYIYASAPAFDLGKHKLKLRNTTDSSDTLIGTGEMAQFDYFNQTRSFLAGRFTIAAQKTFELQHRSEQTQTTDGFGVASNFSVVEVYADVQIWKVA